MNKKRAINTSSYHLTENINEILEDEELDIVVEVMGGIEPTVEWLKAFLSKGIHVITANKDLLAVHLRDLEDLAEKNKVALKHSSVSRLKFLSPIPNMVSTFNFIIYNLIL